MDPNFDPAAIYAELIYNLQGAMEATSAQLEDAGHADEAAKLDRLIAHLSSARMAFQSDENDRAIAADRAIQAEIDGATHEQLQAHALETQRRDDEDEASYLRWKLAQASDED